MWENPLKPAYFTNYSASQVSIDFSMIWDGPMHMVPLVFDVFTAHGLTWMWAMQLSIQVSLCASNFMLLNTDLY